MFVVMSVAVKHSREQFEGVALVITPSRTRSDRRRRCRRCRRRRPAPRVSINNPFYALFENNNK